MTSASVPLWPCAVPACALRDGWSLEPEDPNKRTEMDGGAVAVEPRFSLIRTAMPHAWRFSPREFEVFKGFWARTLEGGRLWFEAPVFDGSCTKRRRVRFDGPWRAAMPVQGFIRVEARLELRDLPQASAADQEALAVGLLIPDPDAFAAEIGGILGDLPGGSS